MSPITAFACLSLAATTLAAPLLSRQTGQIVPDLPQQADLAIAQTYVNAAVTKYSGTHGTGDYYGEALNAYLPIDDSLDAAIGQENVIAIDVLADRACIAAADQGSICNELLAYAYTVYAAQQKTATFRTVAEALGPANMKIVADDMRVACLSQNSAVFGQEQYEICQLIAFDADNLANSIIGGNTQGNPENAGNFNTMEYLGIKGLFPEPQPILP